MRLLKIGIFASACSGIGTAAFILFSWIVSGFHLPAVGILLPFSLVGAALGSAVSWHHCFPPETHRGTATSH